MRNVTTHLVALAAASALAARVPAADSSTSAPEFADGNPAVSRSTNDKPLETLFYKAAVRDEAE